MPENHDLSTVNRQGLLRKLSGLTSDALLGDGTFGSVSGFLNVKASPYKAKGDGSTDDSAAVTAAIAALTALGGGVVFFPPGSYVIHDVSVPTGVVIFAYGAFFLDKSGADFIFSLTGFSSKLLGAYISGASHCSVGALVVDDGKKCLIADTDIVSATSCVVLKSSSAGGNGYGCTQTRLVNVTGDSFSGVGVDTQANVSNTQGTNLYMDANTVAGGGGLIPRAGSTGFSFVGTGSSVAFGGHQFSNCTAINSQSGWVFTDTNLCMLDQCIADSLSGAGYTLNGNTNAVDLGDSFAGTCARGVLTAGTATSNKTDAVRNYGIGSIPSFGGTTWYSSAGFSAPFYDVEQQGTAKLAINLDNWVSTGSNAHTFLEAVALSIQMTGGVQLNFNSNTTIAAGTTAFLALNGQTSTAGAAQQVTSIATVANFRRCLVFVDTAPGALKSFTYTLHTQAQGDTGITGTITGAGVFQATFSGGPVGIAASDSVSLKVVTDAGAAAATHRGFILLIPQPA